jgi:hypothetical protein
MTRDGSLRLDSLLMGVNGSLDMVAHYMKNNLTDEEYKSYITHIGRSMGETIEISNDLHRICPDIIPDELK